MKPMTKIMYSRRVSIPRALRGFTPDATPRWGLLYPYYFLGTPRTAIVILHIYLSQNLIVG